MSRIVTLSSALMVAVTAAPVSTTTTRTGISHTPATAATHKGAIAHLSADLTQSLNADPPA